MAKMDQQPTTTPSDLFIKELRRALNHLYDPDFLRASPLAVDLRVSGRFDTPSALQSLLIRTIESMKPQPGVPNKNHAQAVYDLLLYRYVQQLNQDDIANQLGVSVRHLRRQQNQAVDELAYILWKQIKNDINHQPTTSEKAQPPPAASTDLDWLSNPAGDVTTDLALALDEVRVLIQPFVEQRNTLLKFPESQDKSLVVHPVAFQQILLSLLSAVIQQNVRQYVNLSMVETDGWVTFEVSAVVAETFSQEMNGLSWLQSVKQMINLSGGRFDARLENNTFLTQVSFQEVDKVNVLAVDDNPEIITMMQRFTAETRYHITGLNDPKLVIEKALAEKPDLIVLDIMMPQVDGLHVLSRIKHHPILTHLPVIVCSVLPQKDLAESLGANFFIKKPIQREVFLNVLGQAASESR